MASIELKNVGVHYLIPQAKSAGLVGAVRSLAMGGVIGKQHGRVGVTALDDISLSLANGDRLGLIGHNGAGKSTLLRVLAGILPPTSGRIRVEGRISALMSIQLGLDSYSTGYENIRSRARFMGLTEDEIDAKFDDIASFSELGDYLDLPIRSYSAGMRLRLAFSIATAFSPEILILDEWLSAGDDYFQKKARTRLTGLIDKTGIFAFASHNDGLMERMCNKGLVLHQGKPAFFGEIKEALAFHKDKPKT
ncbi:ABC transporter ATP-binding protein [Hyphococcus formosus]|uniref:ABC transporter ATP-binding protein n=1 Tax=Hyphococcus formosus TaxID=3143534 RepID=UPI00398AADD1